MYRKSSALLLVAAVLLQAAFGGVVSPITRCGGVGTPVQLRISGCEGRCQLQAGTRYDVEEDFFPSSPAQSLSLRVDVCHLGFCWTIVEADLPNSSVQPGFMYTARYTIVPNDILIGESPDIQGMLYHTGGGLVEICIQFQVDVV